LKKILFIVAHRPGRSPGQRFRFEQYLDYLSQNGFEYSFSFLLNEQDDRIFYAKGHYFQKFLILIKSIIIRFSDLKKIKNFDIVFIYREAVMFGSAFFERRMKKKGAHMILDYDDAIWLMDVSEGNRNLKWLKKPEKTEKIIRYCEMVFVGNNYLGDYARKFNNNVKIIPTTLDTNTFVRTLPHRENDSICIGWTGSSTTLKHFGLALPFLKTLKEIYGERIRVKLISDVAYVSNEIPIEFCRWKRESEVSDLCDIDIGIMPLPDDTWSRGKCGFKGLQYMALEIPAVMSPVGVNCEIITDGQNGFLADEASEWVLKISKLIDSAELRRQLGKAGRKTIEERYSFNALKTVYLDCFNSFFEDHS
jgi:glycosyltransferase involved in cell wall biosynthesis